jgi:hypothetical protein
MTINVSLDGTGEAYERVRIGAKFDEVRANIRKLKEVVHAAPSPKANIGISMCVMKSNILDLPNLVRFARDEVLQFGMSPVITKPPDESLRCFNDPAKDMAGWSEAIDAAKAELDSYFPSLAVVWRAQSVPEETQETWRNLFEVLRAQIPLDLADVPHRRVTLDIPDELMVRAAAKHDAAPLVAYIFPQGATDGVSYWGPIKNGRCEVSLPDGAFSIGVSTKWAAAVGNAGFFDVGDHRSDDAVIAVQVPTSRYSPRRVAAGVIRRARRMLDRVTEG